MTREEFHKWYKETQLNYSTKNIFRNSISLLTVLGLYLLLSDSVSTKRMLLMVLVCIVLAILQITVLRFIHNRNKGNMPPYPKFGDKTYKEHQEAKKAKSKDA